MKSPTYKKLVPKTSTKKKVNNGRPKTSAKHRPKSPPQQITGPVYFRVPLIGAGAAGVTVSPIKANQIVYEKLLDYNPTRSSGDK